MYVSNNSPVNVYFDDVTITPRQQTLSSIMSITRSACKPKRAGRGRITATGSCTTQGRN